MGDDNSRGTVRDRVRRGLEEARGNNKIVARMFNMDQRDYKRFLNFLRKHDCQMPFQKFRNLPARFDRGEMGERMAGMAERRRADA